VSTQDKRWWLWRPPKETKYIGKYIPRRDAAGKAAGWHKYVNDIKLPGMLYAKPLRSPYANCVIRNMDTSRAEKVPGVVTVLRWDDPWFKDKWPAYFYEYFPFYPLSNISEAGPIPFIMNRAWWYGQPVGAIVVAETEESCDEALSILKKDTEWEELPFCLDWEESEKCAFPILPEIEKILPTAKDNMEFPPSDWTFGDVEEGFREADRIVEAKVRWRDPNTWATAAPWVAIAHWTGDILKIWTDTQAPTNIRRQIHDILGLPMSCIDIESPYGSCEFGGAAGAIKWVFGTVAALLSYKFKRPVKVIGEQSIWEGCEHVLGTYKFKVGFKNDGTITAVKVETIAVEPGLFTKWDQVSKLFKGSKIPNIQLHAEYPMTNTGERHCSKHGAPACLVHYVVINLVADALGMDPTEVALKNDGCVGHDINWIYEHIAKKQGFDTTRWSLKECIDIGKKIIGWNEKWHKPGAKRLPDGKYHGMAFGYTISWSHDTPPQFRGFERPPIRVYLSLNSDGSLRIIAYRSDTGIDSATTYSVIVADEMGLRLEDVYIERSSMKEFTLRGQGGSSGAAANTPLLVYAARKMKRKILDVAIRLPQFKGRVPEELDIKDSVIFEKANPENAVSIADFAKGPGAGLGVEASISELWKEQSPPTEQPCMVRQVTFVEVKVDPETGQVDITHVVRVYDCGKVINLGTVKGQLYPYWGIGRGLTEALYHDPITGIWLNDNFVQYPILLMNDIKKIDIQFIESGLAYGAYGLCGCSEAGAAATTPIVPLAVYNAIGKWIEDWPTTPDRVLKALGKD